MAECFLDHPCILQILSSDSPYAEGNQLPMFTERCPFNGTSITKCLHLISVKRAKLFVLFWFFWMRGYVFLLEATPALHLPSKWRKDVAGSCPQSKEEALRESFKTVRQLEKRRTCLLGHKYRKHLGETAWRSGQAQREKDHLLVLVSVLCEKQKSSHTSRIWSGNIGNSRLAKDAVRGKVCQPVHQNEVSSWDH